MVTQVCPVKKSEELRRGCQDNSSLVHLTTGALGWRLEELLTQSKLKSEIREVAFLPAVSVMM